MRKSFWITRQVTILFFLAVLSASTAIAELQINTITEGMQWQPRIAALNGGGFVIVWIVNHGDIHGQLFDRYGNKINAEFVVNTTTTNEQLYPEVAAFPNGGFVVVWDSNANGTDYDIMGQRFNSAGNKIGSEFRINSYLPNNQRVPHVATLPNNGFIVTWYSEGKGVCAQLFDSDGVLVNTEFQSTIRPASWHTENVVAAFNNGDFIIIFPSQGDIFGTRFDMDGNNLGEFSVTTNNNEQFLPAIEKLTDQSFIVAWSDVYYGHSTHSILGQRFRLDDASAAQPIGPEFRIDSNLIALAGSKSCPVITSRNDGSFVVMWSDNTGQDGSADGVFGRQFDSDGQPIGQDFQVNTYTSGIQSVGSVDTLANGDIVAIWQSDNQDGSMYGVYGSMTVANFFIEDIYCNQYISELDTAPIKVKVRDVAGADLSYSWTTLNGGVITGSGSSVIFDPPNSGPHPCPYQVRVTVTSDTTSLSKEHTIDIYVKLSGDVNGDGVVNILDKVAVRNQFGQTGCTMP